MKTDAIVLGAELEALVAALRLAERGLSVRLLAGGAGSLPYAPGGVQLLGYATAAAEAVEDPYRAIDGLDMRHPLRLLGDARIRAALGWFQGLAETRGLRWQAHAANVAAVTLAGLPRPVLSHPRFQAVFDDLRGGRIAIVAFNGFRDFPADLAPAALRRQGIDATVVAVNPGIPASDAVRFAHALDRPETTRSVLACVGEALPAGTTAALFPALLGLTDHEAVAAMAEETLGMPVREIATLPPCLFGVRLHRTLLDALDRAGVFIHLGVRDLRAEIAGGRCREIRDGDGRRYQADGYIAGTGGVLMGGLEVGSDGIVADPVFGLPVRQTHPLDQSTPSAAADALHRAGIATDADFRPRTADGRSVENLRIVGATLADWNPCEEGSLEGVAIGTGWAAAEATA